MEKLAILITGGVLGFLLKVIQEVWLDKRKKKSEAEYHAIRVICVFYEFIDICAEVASDNGYHLTEPDYDNDAKIQIKSPTLKLDFKDANWEALPLDLTYEILSFKNLINAAERRINDGFIHTFASEDRAPEYENGFKQRRLEYAKLGLNACRLINKIQNTFNIPSKYKQQEHSKLWLELELTELEKETIDNSTQTNEKEINGLK